MATGFNYALAEPSFVTGPKEELAAVDVYDVQESSIINSYQDVNTDDGGLLSSVTNSLKNLDLKTILSAAQTGLSTAAKLSQAFNQIKSGYIYSAMGGVTNLARMGGNNAIMSLASKAVGVVGIVKGGSMSNISKALAIGGTALGGDGAALTKLASTYTGLERQTSSLSYALGRGDLTYALSSGSMLAGSASRALSDMDAASQINFKAAAAATFNLDPQTNTGIRLSKSSAATAAGISSSVYDLTDGNYTTTINDRAGMSGMIAGLSLAGSKIGMTDVFGTFAKNVQDKQVLTTAARPLMTEASNLGDARLFNSIAGVPSVAKELSSFMPSLTRKMAANVLPPEDLSQRQYSVFYNDLKTNLDAVDPSWKQKKRGNQTVINTTFTSQNDFMTDLLASKLNTNTGHLTQLVESVNNSTPGQVTQVSIDDEAFMLVGSRFKNVSVASSLKEDFPDFYAGLDKEPQDIFV